MGKELDAATAFSSLCTYHFRARNSDSVALINIMVLPLVMFPILIGFIVQATVAVSRLNKFLLSEEIDANAVESNPFGKESIIVEGMFK